MNWFMSHVPLGRLAAATVLAASVAALGAVPAGAAITDRHDAWQSVNGTGICGMRTSTPGGGELALLVVRNQAHLLARDPAWHMHADWQIRVGVAIGDQRFDGDATASDGQTLVVTNLSGGLLRQLIAGGEMQANFGGVRWTMHLTGSAAAIEDMIACVADTRPNAGA